MENNIPVQEKAVEEKKDGKEKRVKAFNIILAIIMAVCLWAYVVGEVNPETHKTITDVPLTVTGESDLEANGLVMLTELSDTVDVVVSGRRSEVYDMSASKITARLDVSRLHEGENQVSIKVTAPSNVDEAIAKDGDFIIVVDTMVREEKPVVIDFKGNPGSGSNVAIEKISTEKVVVSGPKTIVAMVENVVGVLEVNASEDTYIETLVLKPLDAEGNEVMGVELSTNSVQVEAVKSLTKTVPVIIELKGTPPEGYAAEIDSEVNLRITGDSEDIKDVNEIIADAVDVSRMTETATVTVKAAIPAGVSALDSVGKIIKDNSGKVDVEVKIKVTPPPEDQEE